VSYLVRKITRAKWDNKDGLDLDETPADAVTADLRTSGNTLSFWKIETQSDDEFCMTALALITAAQCIERMDLAWVENDSICTNKITIISSDGRTPVTSLRSNHVDLANLDLGRLCKIAGFIVEALSLGQYRRFTKLELIQIIIDAVKKNLVSIDDLEPDVKMEIEKRLCN
jgi:hypothetical protein